MHDRHEKFTIEQLEAIREYLEDCKNYTKKDIENARHQNPRDEGEGIEFFYDVCPMFNLYFVYNELADVMNAIKEKKWYEENLK